MRRNQKKIKDMETKGMINYKELRKEYCFPKVAPQVSSITAQQISPDPIKKNVNENGEDWITGLLVKMGNDWIIVSQEAYDNTFKGTYYSNVYDPFYNSGVSGTISATMVKKKFLGESLDDYDVISILANCEYKEYSMLRFIEAEFPKAYDIIKKYMN